MESDAFLQAMPANFQDRDQDFAKRLEPQLRRLQLGAVCNRTHTLPRALTFDMRGAQKAQPFGHPLDGRVRRQVAHGFDVIRSDTTRPVSNSSIQMADRSALSSPFTR